MFIMSDTKSTVTSLPSFIPVALPVKLCALVRGFWPDYLIVRLCRVCCLEVSLLKAKACLIKLH